MRAKELVLTDFRNVQHQVVSFSPEINFLIGPNAQGKTNFIESIYFLAHGKSFRTKDHRDLIRWGCEEGRIELSLEMEEGEDQVISKLNLEKKEVYKNDKKTTGNIKTLFVVLFAPEEILVIKGSPHGRRQYIDTLLSKLSPSYFKTLKNYQRVVVQKNKLLKSEEIEEKKKRELLETWEGPLVDLGGELIRQRREWLERFNRFVGNRYDDISRVPSFASLEYCPEVEENGESFQKRIQEKRELELILKRALVGPHLDDYSATVCQKELKHFGSQGEARTFSLSLKLAEVDLIKEIHERQPILLLDDVVSELDEERNNYLFHYLENFSGQVIVTAVGAHLLPARAIQNGKIFSVKEGKI